MALHFGIEVDQAMRLQSPIRIGAAAPGPKLVIVIA
jgi:hypothetical protein